MDNLRDDLILMCDRLLPLLDTYEQAIYFYAFRHSRLIGKEELVLSLKSDRRRIALGIGEKGKPMAENTAYEKLRSLAAKGAVVILDTVHGGTRVHVMLPDEMPLLSKPDLPQATSSVEEVDYFADKEGREAIFEREGRKCFYCLKSLDARNFVIEHIVSRPKGNNSYRNVVAACRHCNNLKGDARAESFLRERYRSGFLSDAELAERLAAVRAITAGERPPATR